MPLNDGSIYDGGPPPAPSSPFPLHALSHGVFDRCDLVPASSALDVWFGDTHSTFSDLEMMTSSFRSPTHHST